MPKQELGISYIKKTWENMEKVKMNSNGEYLLDILRENEMVVTNTLFPHKMSHRTTWTAPERVNYIKHFDGTTRKNSSRNQIDYIIVKHQYMSTNSRSYSGFEIYTDHKLVKMVMRLDW